MVMSRRRAKLFQEERPPSTAIFCPIRAQLAEEFLHAIHNLTRLHTQQSQALIDGDPEFARFDLLIHMASEQKEEAKYALMSHIQTHKCDEEVEVVSLTQAEKRTRDTTAR